MKEILLNDYVKVEPLIHESFVVREDEKQSYEEIGKVLAVADGVSIPIGARVYFDSYIAKRYPVPGTKDFQWFVPLSEIVKYEVDAP